MKTFGSIPELLLSRVAATPSKVAFLSPQQGGWQETTWRQFGDQVRAVACALLALGLEKPVIARGSGEPGVGQVP